MLKTPQLHPLTNNLNERYDGNTNALIKHLDEAMYMLFFLEEDTFSRKDVQTVVYALKNLKEGFEQVASFKEPVLQH